MKITKDLVNFCYTSSFNKLSSEVIERTKYFALDYIGVLLRGSKEESSKAMRKFIDEITYVNEGGLVIGSEKRAPYQYAALSNGAAAHSLELDDVNNESSLHPGVVIFPAVFAACEMAEKGGEEFIEGIAIGYDVMIRLGKALNPRLHYARGFHPTGTCGAFGATLAVAKILGLSEKQMLNAIGIAGSQTAGSMEFLTEGAWTKRMHPGWAAHNGIIACLLAKNGFTGPSTIIEGKFGFLHSYTDSSSYEKILDGLGEDFEILKTSIKPHACCRYMQAPIDAILKIIKENNIKFNNIKKITLGILEAGFDLIASPIEKKRNPKLSYEAQFSMPYGAAVAVLFGKVTLDEFTNDKLKSREIKELMEKVYCIKNPDLDKEYPKYWPATAEILTNNNKIFSTYVKYPKGDPENSLTWGELIEKFKRLAMDIYSDEKQNKIIAQVENIENIKYWNPILLQDSIV